MDSRPIEDGLLWPERDLRRDLAASMPLFFFEEHPDCEMSLEEWAAALREFDPVGMDGPPLPAYPALAITHEARLALYARRAELGLALHHPDDVHDLDRLPEGLSAEGLDVRQGYTRVRGLKEAGL